MFTPPDGTQAGGSLFAPPSGVGTDGPAATPAPSNAPYLTHGEANAAALGNLTAFDIDDEPISKKARKAKSKGKVRKVETISTAPGGSNSNKSAPKSKLPLLLGILAVVVIGAGAFFLLKGDDDAATDGVEVAGTTVDKSTTTVPAAGDPATTVAPGGATTAVPGATTIPDSATTVPPTTAAPTPEQVVALQAAFDAESTRACDAIKADPGLFTEDVIKYDEAWAAIPKSYEDLQKSVNECSYQARDEAFKKIAAEDAAKGG
jgi:hypothetical protein